MTVRQQALFSGGQKARLGQRAGMSPERKAALARRHNDYALRVAPSAGVARGGVSAVFRAVLVPIDRISLLVTHLGVAVERAPAALLPPPIEPQRH
jgi:hypothetical protein